MNANVEIMENKNEEIEMVVCYCCGEEIPKGKATEFDGEHFCNEDCLNEETFICDHCGKREWRDNSYYMESTNEEICDDCYSYKTVQCEYCEETIWEWDDYGDSNISLCQHCRDWHYYTCDECGALVYQYDVCSDDEGDYCPDCYKEKCNGIKDYSYKPSPKFYGKYDHNGDTTNRYFGVELEVDHGEYRNNTAREILDIANCEEEHIYIKQDGSLDEGMEIVSHPMTLGYHKDVMDWEEVFRTAIYNGFRSHQTNTCGLHVHVNRNSLGSTEEEQDKAIAKIIYFIELHWAEITKFTRRETYFLNKWAARYGYEKTAKEVGDKAKKDGNRYHAVNLNNYYTIEFRIFRGTLKYNTFIATLQFVNHVCDIGTALSGDEINNLSWGDFVAAITEPELIQYLKERQLYINEEITSEEEV